MDGDDVLLPTEIMIVDDSTATATAAAAAAAAAETADTGVDHAASPGEAVRLIANRSLAPHLVVAARVNSPRSVASVSSATQATRAVSTPTAEATRRLSQPKDESASDSAGSLKPRRIASMGRLHRPSDLQLRAVRARVAGSDSHSATVPYSPSGASAGSQESETNVVLLFDDSPTTEDVARIAAASATATQQQQQQADDPGPAIVSTHSMREWRQTNAPATTQPTATTAGGGGGGGWCSWLPCCGSRAADDADEEVYVVTTDNPAMDAGPPLSPVPLVPPRRSRIDSMGKAATAAAEQVESRVEPGGGVGQGAGAGASAVVTTKV